MMNNIKENHDVSIHIKTLKKLQSTYHNLECHRVPSVCTDLWCNTMARVHHPGSCSSFQVSKCNHGNVETARSIPGKFFRTLWCVSFQHTPIHYLSFCSLLHLPILKALRRLSRLQSFTNFTIKLINLAGYFFFIGLFN